MRNGPSLLNPRNPTRRRGIAMVMLLIALTIGLILALDSNQRQGSAAPCCSEGAADTGAALTVTYVDQP